ncbi:Acetyltransferase (GNAT) family protein [Roseivivax jejudonensis]|uniref:Acetyltransferase (GNAT) family protein n=1 Tax=Roseivivax jejudonensis TaxID=1529041 RepID=A0A1X6Y9A8_9RHOB|nr:N-acetyltransferase [Roseivivax jejudonensis]SLN14144.1 Acetyltransferase (GNAT) family protein [Roseivivax jejudonensis]
MFRTQFLREMQPGEEPAVDALLRAAFGQADEARIVTALRREGRIAGECIVPGDDGPVGYFALSAMRAPDGWLCLAPVAVAPEAQGQGVGRRMIGMLSAWTVAAGQTVVVLGEPGFYERCGFSVARARNLTSPYPVAHTALARPGQDAPTATLTYPKALSPAS